MIGVLEQSECGVRTKLSHKRLQELQVGELITRSLDEQHRHLHGEEVRSALEGAVSKTAEKALGLREIDSLSADDARDRIVARTRQYAAYQRKWMRRIPGLVMVDATRPTAEVVDAILEVARAR